MRNKWIVNVIEVLKKKGDRDFHACPVAKTMLWMQWARFNPW